MEYNINKIEEIFKKYKISQFEVKNVFTNKENSILIHVLPKETLKETLGEYLAKKDIRYLKFRSDNIIYEVKRAFININSTVYLVYIITKDGSIEQAVSRYEVDKREDFSNDLLLVNIDEIITEE